MFTPDAFAFFAELAAHNDRDWFAANKARYERAVKAPFAALLAAVTLRLEDSETPYIGGAATMFRIHRDTRFSHDKSPYKTNTGGLLTPDGAKDMGRGMIYVHLDATGGFCAAGIYMPPPLRLAALRDGMAAAPAAFLALADALAARGLPLSDEGSLTRMPRGYERHADTPLAPHLRRKHLFVQEPLPRESFLDGSAPDRIADHARRAAPLLAFCRRQ
jgi:uncharacterized protein (TIGR02453 family)